MPVIQMPRIGPELEPTEKEIAEAKVQHADREMFLIQGKNFSVIAVVPNRMEVDRWRQATVEAKNRTRATAEFVQNAIVWPARQALLELLNRKPFLIEEWFAKIWAEAGGAEETEVKKL